MPALKIQRIGDELGVALPQEWLREAGLGEGDAIAARVSEREIALLTPADSVGG